MPYASNDDLPETIKNKYNDKEQTIFREAFNGAFEGTCKDREDREGCAFAIAHDAVEKAAKEERKEAQKMEWEKPRFFNLMIEPGKFVEENGSLIVKDVIALAEGTWTDSNVRTPCRYSAEALRDKVTIKDNGLWCRHSGGSPRAVNEKIGTFQDAGYSEKYRARMVDLILHRRSQQSRDVAEMIQAGIINMVSAEVGGEEWYDPKSKVYEALNIDFYGLAAVDKGACEVCMIRHKEKPDERKPDLDPPSEGRENESMDEETKKAIADLNARLSKLEKSLQDEEEKKPDEEEKKEEGKKTHSEPPEEKVGELEKLVTEMRASLEEAKKKIKALETTARSASEVDKSDPAKKELERVGGYRIRGGEITRE